MQSESRKIAQKVMNKWEKKNRVIHQRKEKERFQKQYSYTSAGCHFEIMCPCAECAEQFKFRAVNHVKYKLCVLKHGTKKEFCPITEYVTLQEIDIPKVRRKIK